MHSNQGAGAFCRAIQQQRVLIVRALVSEPEILLLDEPTANIDTRIQKEIYELLYGMKKNTTVIMATCDLSAVSVLWSLLLSQFAAHTAPFDLFFGY